MAKLLCRISWLQREMMLSEQTNPELKEAPGFCSMQKLAKLIKAGESPATSTSCLKNKSDPPNFSFNLQIARILLSIPGKERPVGHIRTAAARHSGHPSRPTLRSRRTAAPRAVSRPPPPGPDPRRPHHLPDVADRPPPEAAGTQRHPAERCGPRAALPSLTPPGRGSSLSPAYPRRGLLPEPAARSAPASVQQPEARPGCRGAGRKRLRRGRRRGRSAELGVTPRGAAAEGEGGEGGRELRSGMGSALLFPWRNA